MNPIQNWGTFWCALTCQMEIRESPMEDNMEGEKNK